MPAVEREAAAAESGCRHSALTAAGRGSRHRDHAELRAGLLRLRAEQPRIDERRRWRVDTLCGRCLDGVDDDRLCLFAPTPGPPSPWTGPGHGGLGGPGRLVEVSPCLPKELQRIKVFLLAFAVRPRASLTSRRVRRVRRLLLHRPCGQPGRHRTPRRPQGAARPRAAGSGHMPFHGLRPRRRDVAVACAEPLDRVWTPTVLLVMLYMGPVPADGERRGEGGPRRARVPSPGVGSSRTSTTRSLPPRHRRGACRRGALTSS